MENISEQQDGYAVAKERVHQLKKFYVSLVLFSLVFIIYGFIKFNKTGNLTFLELNNWSAIFWIWGIILILKAIKLLFFNPSWERKMIEKQFKK